MLPPTVIGQNPAGGSMVTNWRFWKCSLLVCWLGVCTAACSSSPTAPSIIQVGGLWAGSTRLANVTGGECVGTTLSALSLGTVQNYTVQITQTGASLSATVDEYLERRHHELHRHGWVCEYRAQCDVLDSRNRFRVSLLDRGATRCEFHKRHDKRDGLRQHCHRHGGR